MSGLSRSVARGLIAMIEAYRTMISPLRPASCRFTPTCSQYAVEALRVHGLLRGVSLAVCRLARCGPWHQGGWDPIPEPGRAAAARPDAGTARLDDGNATMRSDSVV